MDYGGLQIVLRPAVAKPLAQKPLTVREFKKGEEVYRTSPLSCAGEEEDGSNAVARDCRLSGAVEREANRALGGP